jgi:GntR family transcriptional regulator
MGRALAGKLKRRVPQPLYRQLISDLLEQVSSGQLEPGDELPSLRELMKTYDVSSITARRALDVLRQQGSIFSVPGKGTYVAEARVTKFVGIVESFSQDMGRNGLRPSSVVLNASLCAATPRVAKMLAISPAAEVVHLERVRMADDIPMCVQVSHLPHQLCPGLLRHDFSHASLYHILQQEYGLGPARSSPRIRAGLARERELSLLLLSPPACVLWVESQVFLPSGQVMEYALTAYRADRYEIPVAAGAVVAAQIQEVAR